MDTEYRRLFRLDIRHPYYSDGLCRGLSVTPTASCAQRIRDGGCRARVDAGGVELWYGTADGHAPVMDLDARFPFSFSLTPKGPEFFEVTEPTWGEGVDLHEVLYLSSIGSKIHSDNVNGTASFAIPPDTGTKTETRGHAFAMETGKIENADAVTLEPWTGGSPVWRQVARKGPMDSMMVNLADVPNGRYLLKNGDTGVLNFYLLDRPSTGVFGVIDIYTGGIPAIIQDGHMTPATFTLQFQTRKTTWRYMVVDRTASSDFGQAEITGSAAKIRFGAPTSGTVRGRPAWAFQSEQPIPLYEAPRSHHTFALSGLMTDGKPRAPMTLPYASPAGTTMQKTPSGPQMVSSMYVYVD